MRLSDLRRMPPGDREPRLRVMAARALLALDRAEGAPRLPGRDAAIAHGRRIAARRADLRRLLSLANHHAITLQPAVTERANLQSERIRTMQSNPHSLALWSEDLSEQPHHERIRDLLRTMIVDEGTLKRI